MRRFLSAALATLLLVAPCFASRADHHRAEKATLVLFGHSEMYHKTKALCTAFVYERTNDGYNLMTAGHCFGGDLPEDLTYEVAETVTSEKHEAVEVLCHIDQGRMDVATLHYKTNHRYEVLELGDQPTKIDDKVFFVGFPEMLGETVFTGRVASDVIESDDNGKCNMCRGRVIVQLGGGPGASGSPIISEKTGKVVGVLEGTYFQDGTAMVPASEIKKYLQTPSDREKSFLEQGVAHQ